MNGVGAPVAIVMGSQSDWPTMIRAAEMLDKLGVAYDLSLIHISTIIDELLR